MTSFEKQCARVERLALRANISVLYVQPHLADELGAQGLQIIANRCGLPIVTSRDSKHHGDKLIRPESGKPQGDHQDVMTNWQEAL